MNALIGFGERALGVLIGLLTVPLLILGVFVGLRGSLRYFKARSM